MGCCCTASQMFSVSKWKSVQKLFRHNKYWQQQTTGVLQGLWVVWISLAERLKPGAAQRTLHHHHPSSGYNSSSPLNDFWQPLISGHTCVWHPQRGRFSVSLFTTVVVTLWCLMSEGPDVAQSRQHQLRDPTGKEQVEHLNVIFTKKRNSGMIECEGFVSQFIRSSLLRRISGISGQKLEKVSLANFVSSSNS